MIYAQTILAADIDDVQFSVSPGFGLVVKILVAIFLFGVALDSKPSDFKDVVRRPGALVACLVTQYVLIPALTLGLIAILDVNATVALGIIFVACCPSGNLSNLLTHRAHGNVTMSVSLTSVSNASCIVLTPLAFAFWGNLNGDVAALMRQVSIDVPTMAIEVGLLIGLPFLAGALAARQWPGFAGRARKPVEKGTLILLILLIVAGAAGQASAMLVGVTAVLGVVVIQNLMSLGTGYAIGRACRLPVADVRAMTFEIGVRNTALATVLVIAYFNGLGGAILAVAFWGAIDSITGLLLSSWWRRRPIADPSTPQPEPQEATS